MRRFYIVLFIFVAVAAVFSFAPIFGGFNDDIVEERVKISRKIPENTENALALINDITDIYGTPASEPMDSMPDDGCVRMHINPIGGPIRSVLRDSNYLHYGVGRLSGIDPIVCDADAWHTKKPLVRVTSCKEFYVDELKHSYPYLIPEADRLLHQLGQRFNDSLMARGGGDYRLKVTSMLRTNKTVRRLRRVNRAAVDSSSHQFGTTFDVSYTRFMLTKTGGVYRTQEDLKNLLAEILVAMRKEDLCYVIFEPRSGCFHITARPKNHPRIMPPKE